jgi:ADP-heptose:LPS heptosyltransferase
MKKILIIKPTSLGDVVITTSVIPEIKKAFPNSHITWLVDKPYESFVKLCSGVDATITSNLRKWRGLKSIPTIHHFLKSLKNYNFDITLDLQGLLRSALMTKYSKAKRKIGLKTSREGAHFFYTELVNDKNLGHRIKRYKKAVEHLTQTQIKSLYTLNKPKNTTEILKKYNLINKKYVVIHPFCTADERTWNYENYNLLIKSMPHQHFVLLGIGKEFEIPTQNTTDLRNKTTLNELSSIIASSETTISPDSGPGHIAAAFGINVITIFIKHQTDPKEAKPIGRGKTYPIVFKKSKHTNPKEIEKLNQIIKEAVTKKQ